MDVALPQVLFIHVLVRLMAVREGRVIVLVAVAGDEVGEVLAGPVVVGDVHMVMRMHNGIVLVRFSHCFLPRVCEPPGITCREPVGARLPGIIPDAACLKRVRLRWSAVDDRESPRSSDVSSIKRDRTQCRPRCRPRCLEPGDG
jgi:hypothetical protein